VTRLAAFGRFWWDFVVGDDWRVSVEIVVADSGPGFAPDARGHLFELFFTTKERGTGLGLPLTREILVAHGGTICAEPARADEGGGARFVLWLPGPVVREAHRDGRESGSDAA